ncbi:MAG: right-handed parallel beta-helix repeat-containing protein [Candidatus Kariarchaeaceae archaeon]
MKSKKIALISLLIITLLNLSHQQIQANNQITGTLEFNSDSAITITSNDGFGEIATEGDGSRDNPWILENLNITSGSVLISISNTDQFFTIRNSNLQGGENGIRLNNVQNGFITNNFIWGNGENGITGIDSSNILIQDNELNNNGGTACESILDLARIALDSHAGSGVFFDPSSNIHIIGNRIHDNALYGIILDTVTEGAITGNSISSNGLDSCIPIHGGHGVELLNSQAVEISYNNITFNHQYGLNLNGTSNANIIKLNNFINNTLVPQANDVGTNNVFTDNHWSEWTDELPYEIDGGNIDNSPSSNVNELIYNLVDLDIFPPLPIDTDTIPTDTDSIPTTTDEVNSQIKIIIVLIISITFKRGNKRFTLSK